MIIDSINKELLIEILEDYFLYANMMAIKKNEDCISNNISERFICACLKAEFDLVINRTIFTSYYADVEYNRGSGRTRKSYMHDGEVFKMTCDFILHSRGKLPLDNLICLEMKKSSSSNDRMNNDRNRLSSLTVPGGCETVDNNMIVRNYVLGIFYIIDTNNRTAKFEYYKDGVCFEKHFFTFDQIKSYKPSFLFLNHRNIVFFNMNFGDSFLIRDSSESLLVDCGSRNQTKLRKNYMENLISKEMDSSDKKLLITHYHSDHTTSLLGLAKRGVMFESLYVRCLGSEGFKFDFYSAFIEIITYVKKSKDYNTFINWFSPKGLLSLITSSGTVYGVNNKINNNINIGSSTAKVLWPIVECINFKKLEEIANKVESLLFDDIGENDFLTSTIGKIKAMYIFYESIYEGMIERHIPKDEILSLAEEMGVLKIQYNMDEILRFISSIKIPRKIKNSLSDLENHLSIIFEIDSKLLMCGDADNNAIDQALNYLASVMNTNVNKLPPFGIIKVPHHGTINYYYSFNGHPLFLLPNCKMFKPSWGIDKRYVDGKTKCVSLNNGVNSACPNSKTCGYKCPYVGIADLMRIRF